MLGIKKPTKWTEAAGWYGMLALITAYFLASFGAAEPEGLVYQLLNLTGAVGLLIVAASKGVTQSVLLNIFWGVIGIIAFVRLFL